MSTQISILSHISIHQAAIIFREGVETTKFPVLSRTMIYISCIFKYARRARRKDIILKFYFKTFSNIFILLGSGTSQELKVFEYLQETQQ